MAFGWGSDRAARRRAARAEAWERAWASVWTQVDREANLWPAEKDWGAVEAARDLAKTDAAAGLAAIQALAEGGSVAAMIDAGLALWPATGAASDMVLMWFRRAAEADPVGQYYLGRACLGLDKDDEARGAMEAAAAKGFVPAQIFAGYMHQSGRGGPVDEIKANAYYEAALRRQSVAAKLMLGRRLVKRWWNPAAMVRGLVLSLSGVFALVDRNDRGGRADPAAEEFSWWAVPVWIGILALIIWQPYTRAANFWWMAPLVCVVSIVLWILARRERAREREERLSVWPFRPHGTGSVAPGAERP